MERVDMERVDMERVDMERVDMERVDMGADSRDHAGGIHTQPERNEVELRRRSSTAKLKSKHRRIG